MDKHSSIFLVFALVFCVPILAMQKNKDTEITTKVFLEKIVNSKEFTNSGKPIKKMLDIIKTGLEKDEELIDKLISCLDSKKEHVKKNASLALSAISLNRKVDLQKYKHWAEKANKKNFFSVEDAPDGSIVYVIGAFADEGSMIYALQPSLKVSVPVKHKTLTEEWVCLEGNGKFALKNRKIAEKKELGWNVFEIGVGSKVKIDVGVPFQFLNSSKDKPLKFSIITTPPYKDGDAISAPPGYWNNN